MTVHPAQLGRFFDDFEVGDVYQHPFGRTISEADSTWFTQLTCNTNQNHFNAHLAGPTRSRAGGSSSTAASPWRWCSACPVIDMSQNAVANLGWTDIKLTHPVYIGDTIYAESVCTDKRESSSRPGMGIITMITRGLNQDGDVIVSWTPLGDGPQARDRHRPGLLPAGQGRAARGLTRHRTDPGHLPGVAGGIAADRPRPSIRPPSVVVPLLFVNFPIERKA